MIATRFTPSIVPLRSAVARPNLLPAFSLAAVMLFSAAPARAAYGPGAWTPAADWSSGNESKVAVHAVLTRGDNAPYHSRLLFWNSEVGGFFLGGEWGWRPGSTPWTEFPTASFDSLPVNLSGMDIFCSGHTGGLGGDGRVFFAGGTGATTLAHGEKQARIFTPGTGSGASGWTTIPSMTQYRWYPVNVELEDGRIVTLNGNQYPHHRVYGGRTSPTSAPTSPLVQRFAPVEDGAWDSPVTPAPDPQNGSSATRERHSSVEMLKVTGFSGHTYFGGLGELGSPRNDTWILKRNLNVLGADYAYSWVMPPITGSPPPERSEHTAINAMNSMMVMYGGRDLLGNPLPGAWRLFPNPELTWDQMRIDTDPVGLVVPDRYGHTAYYEELEINGVPKQRMVVFGGVTSAGQSPSDAEVYVLTFDPADPDHATWSKPEVLPIQTGTDPAPRTNHTLVPHGKLLAVENLTGYNGKQGNVAYLFGGNLGGTSYSNELWLLWTFEDGKIGWERRDLAGAPSARARHAATFDSEQGEGASAPHRGRLYLYGGENAGGMADRFAYEVQPWRQSPAAAWEVWAEASTALTGHTMVKERQFDEFTFARKAEVFNPATNTWQDNTASTLLQRWYAPSFLAPDAGAGSRVVGVGWDDKTYWLDIPPSGAAGAWQQFPSAVLPFTPASAVMYKPGTVLAAGGVANNAPVGEARRLDLSNTNSAWASSPPMVPRSFHNLIVLPNGQVLAVGGVNSLEDHDLSQPVKRPQIWDPIPNSGQGSWTDTSLVARQGKARNYHAVLVLLPDGTALSAGGHNPDNHTVPGDQHYAEIYWPPYLFKFPDAPPPAFPGKLAPRPSITDALPFVRYGRKFSVCVAPSTDGWSISSACLIRPAATTHGFDQGQRYVPLPLESGIYDPGYISVTGPADSSVAPPGDYMLFVLDTEGVPAIARWVRVGSAWTSTDVTPPDAISGIEAEFVSTNTIIYSWPGTGDDGMTGVASQYDLRYRAATAMSSGNFASCPVAPNVPAPACPNGTQPYSLTGLQSCTKYWIGMKVGDEKNNLSGLSIYGWIKTACSGGGGGFSASEATGVEGGGGSAAPAGTRLRFGSTPTSALSGGTSSRLVAEFGDGATPEWTIRRVSATDDGSLRGLDAGLVVVQDADGAGGWRTRSAFALGAGSLGVRSLARAGRIVFPSAAELEALELDPARFTLTGATHSRDGDLVATSVSPDSPELADGETLTLQYAPRATEGTGQDCFFTVRGVAEATVAHVREAKLAEPPARASSEFSLRVPRPNPFSNATRIPFALASGANTRLEIFDAGGRRVRVLADEWREAGEHEAAWNGRDADGTRVRPGIYVVRLIAGAERAERKIALLP